MINILDLYLYSHAECVFCMNILNYIMLASILYTHVYYLHGIHVITFLFFVIFCCHVTFTLRFNNILHMLHLCFFM